MMRLVADSNVIFTYLWESSALKEIIRQGARLFSPEYALRELEEHWQEIAGKAGIGLEERDGILNSLRHEIEVVPKSSYEKFLPEAESLASAFTGKEETDLRDDADFLALAMLLDCPLWSNDRLLKRQPRIIVLSTKEILTIFKPEKISDEPEPAPVAKKTDNWDSLIAWIRENDKKFKGKKVKIDHDLIAHGVNREGDELLPSGKIRRKR